MNAHSPSPSTAELDNVHTAAYTPTVGDVLHVRRILLTSKPQLPLEIVDFILDQACYWASTSAFISTETVARGGRPGAEDRLILRTLPLGFCGEGMEEHEVERVVRATTPLHIPMEAFYGVSGSADTVPPPRGAHPCRKIEFDIVSHDQGWAGESGHHSYRNSYTWFDAGIEKINLVVPSHGGGDAAPEQVSSFEWDSIFYTASARSLSRPPEASEGDGADDETPEEPNLPRRPLRLPLPPSQIDAIDRELHNLPPSMPARPAISFTVKHPVDAAGALAHPLLPPSTRIQSNMLASHSNRRHVIQWSYLDKAGPQSAEGVAALAEGRGEASVDGAFVRRLEVGDCVTLWAHARFRGWQNTVTSAKVTVWWAV